MHYKITLCDGSAPFQSDYKYTLPIDGQPGPLLTETRKLGPCSYGFHACDGIEQLLDWLLYIGKSDLRVWIWEYSGEVFTGEVAGLKKCYGASGRISILGETRFCWAEFVALFPPELARAWDDLARAWDDLARTYAARDRARADYDRARADYDRTYAARDRAWDDLDRASADLDRARADYDRIWADYDRAPLLAYLRSVCDE